MSIKELNHIGISNYSQCFANRIFELAKVSAGTLPPKLKPEIENEVKTSWEKLTNFYSQRKAENPSLEPLTEYLKLAKTEKSEEVIKQAKSSEESRKSRISWQMFMKYGYKLEIDKRQEMRNLFSDKLSGSEIYEKVKKFFQVAGEKDICEEMSQELSEFKSEFEGDSSYSKVLKNFQEFFSQIEKVN